MDQKRRCTRPQHAKKHRRRGSERAPLQWNPLFLVQFASRLFENMDGMHAVFAAYLAQSVVFRWGSACSGTESPHWVFIALAEAALGHMVFEQVYSAEIDAAKREWIMAKAKPKCLFSDIFDINRLTARCTISGMANVKNVCHNLTTDLFISGFSCKSVSALANDDQIRMSAICDYVGQTGITWWGVVMTLQRTRPKSFILEHVGGLMRHDSHLLVIAKLQALGYIVVWRLCDALECGMPQHRLRIWICGWLRSLVVHPDYFESRMRELLETLLSDHPLMDVEDLLLKEDHPDFMDETIEANVLAQLHRTGRGGTKWIATNSVMCKKKKVSQCQSNWRIDLDQTYPEYHLLSERCKASLDRHNISFPEMSRP